MLTDFGKKFTPELGVPIRICQVMVKKWHVYVDGATNTRGSGIRIVMISPEGVRLEKSMRLGFCASNSEVKYEAFIYGLKVAQQLGLEEVEIW